MASKPASSNPRPSAGHPAPPAAQRNSLSAHLSRKTKQSDGFLQFLERGKVIIEFGTKEPQSYGWLRHNWKQGYLTKEGLKREVKRICDG